MLFISEVRKKYQLIDFWYFLVTKFGKVSKITDFWDNNFKYRQTNITKSKDSKSLLIISVALEDVEF
jgi:hypothetical protein